LARGIGALKGLKSLTMDLQYAGLQNTILDFSPIILPNLRYFSFKVQCMVGRLPASIWNLFQNIQSPQLKSLSVSLFGSSPDIMDRLIQKLTSSPVRKLEIFGCLIHPILIAPLLAQTPSLEHLLLHDCKIYFLDTHGWFDMPPLRTVTFSVCQGPGENFIRRMLEAIKSGSAEKTFEHLNVLKCRGVSQQFMEHMQSSYPGAVSFAMEEMVA